MTKKQSSLSNGSSEDGEARFNIDAQYLKDLSFENPNPLEMLPNQATGAPEIGVGYDVDVQEIENDRYEVTLKVRGTANFEDQLAYVVEVVYGAVVSLINIPEDHRPTLLYVEVPRMLFPYVRNIISDVSRDGGYQSLLLNGIDLVSLFKDKIAKFKEAKEASESGKGSA